MGILIASIMSYVHNLMVRQLQHSSRRIWLIGKDEEVRLSCVGYYLLDCSLIVGPGKVMRGAHMYSYSVTPYNVL